MARMASGMAASSLARHSVAGETVGEPRELLRALFQSSTVGVAICDRQFRFRAINDALAAMTAFLRRRIWARRYMLSLEVPPQKFNPP